MGGYVQKALKQFQHVNGRAKHKIHRSRANPYDMEPRNNMQRMRQRQPKLNKKGKKFIQQVCGKFLFLGRAVDSTLLCPISAIASQAAEPTEDTLRQAMQLIGLFSNAGRSSINIQSQRHDTSRAQRRKLSQRA